MLQCWALRPSALDARPERAIRAPGSRRNACKRRRICAALYTDDKRGDTIPLLDHGDWQISQISALDCKARLSPLLWDLAELSAETFFEDGWTTSKQAYKMQLCTYLCMASMLDASMQRSFHRSHIMAEHVLITRMSYTSQTLIGSVGCSSWVPEMSRSSGDPENWALPTAGTAA